MLLVNLIYCCHNILKPNIMVLKEKVIPCVAISN